MYLVLEGGEGQLVKVIGDYDTLEEARSVVSQDPERRYTGTWKLTVQQGRAGTGSERYTVIDDNTDRNVNTFDSLRDAKAFVVRSNPDMFFIRDTQDGTQYYTLNGGETWQGDN